jgi:hypothetical protein
MESQSASSEVSDPSIFLAHEDQENHRLYRIGIRGLAEIGTASEKMLRNTKSGCPPDISLASCGSFSLWRL